MKKCDFQNGPVFSSKNNDIEAYVISLRGNETAESMTIRCVESLKRLNMRHTIWDAFDGTKGENIIVPERLKDKDYLSWIKLTNGFMSTSELSCFLSHLSLWAHCCTINEPIIILEHDAVMIKPYTIHRYPNSCYYLGNYNQTKHSYVFDWSFEGHTECPMVRYYICATHAYAIDPGAARNLLTHALKYGINDPVDKFMRMDVFTIVQDDIYAYNMPGETTIKHLT